MEKVTNVAEICNLIRNKLIEYGVQEHTAWYDYNQNYRPVIYFFLNNEMEYNSKILARYQELVQKSLKRQPLIFLLSEIFLFSFSQLALWQNLKPVSICIFDKIISSLSSHFVQIKGLVVKFNRLLQV